MSQSFETHNLVIKNLQILEDAPSVVGEIEKKVFTAIDEKFERWVTSQEEWHGIFNYLNDQTSFQPKAWGMDDEKNYLAYYILGYDDSVDELNYSLSYLLGNAPKKFGIYFSVQPGWITGLSGRGVLPKWKEHLAEHFPESGLVELGFELEGGSLFLPFTVKAEVLGEDYPDSIEEALAWVDEALRILGTAHPKLETLLEETKQHFKSSREQA